MAEGRGQQRCGQSFQRGEESGGWNFDAQEQDFKSALSDTSPHPRDSPIAFPWDQAFRNNKESSSGSELSLGMSRSHDSKPPPLLIQELKNRIFKMEE